ncbi:MAG: serine hydrolase [Bacteroidales bacterium]|nr:serine hydrolase [Bacteroidales bacterium]
MTKKRIFYGIAAFLGAIILAACIYLNSLLPIITGYAAKNLCSAVFVSGRLPEDVENLDLNFSFIKFTRNNVDYGDKSVTSRFLWGRSKAIYRDGFGTTLLRDVNEESLRKIKYPGGTEPGYSQDTIKWPLGDIIPDSVTGVDLKALSDVTGKVINDNAYNGNVFAFIVLHKGIPVAEAYKPDFNQHTRLLSWSMAKSFTNAMVGILVRQGRVDIEKPAGIEEWKDDERNAITLNNLMQMQSGLEWNEDYGNRSDVTLMLHCESNMGEFAWEQKEEFPAGSHWYYSSGTTNIVSYLIREELGNDSLYYNFEDTELFNKIGMPDAVFEVDASGTRVGSSYLYATARDYARFGLLYLNNGVFNGERILPEGWVKYSTDVASASGGLYGSFFWLNKSHKLPSAPEDMYACDGHDGQHIYILPTQEMVVVILGYSPVSNPVDTDRLLKDIVNTVK